MLFAISDTWEQHLDEQGVTSFDLRPVLLSKNTPTRRSESEVRNADKEFRIRLELYHYKPEEINITSDRKHITITAKHEEKEDNHGFVSRKITRTYKLPEDIDLTTLKSTMNSQGVLCIKAKKNTEKPKEIPIPVEFTNKRDW